MTASSRELFRFIYLDTEGIDSLFTQTEEWLETERSLAKGTRKKEGLVTKLGIGSPLAFLQLLKADFSAKIDNENERQETSKYVLASEQKLNRLISYLENATPCQLATDIHEAVRTSKETGRPVFLKAHTVFDIPQFYGGLDGCDSANETQTVIWKKPGIEHQYIEGDAWFTHAEEMEIPIIMSTSISKFPSLGSGIGKTSHLAIALRGFRGRNFPVNVFGLLSELPDGCHIKPYALWQ